jgi:phosphopantetheinyl transferase
MLKICPEMKIPTFLKPSKMESRLQAALSSSHPFVAILDRERVLPGIPEESLMDVLTDQEREHIAKLEYVHIRSRYIAGRAVLRLLIFIAAGTPPPRRLFSHGDEGAPLAIECSDGSRLTYSVSHSGPFSLFGFSKGGRIGVDIEAIRPVRQSHDAAEYAFSPEEAKWLKELPEKAGISAFIRTWSRKESVIKFIQGSVAHDMHRFSVPLDTKTGHFTLAPHLTDAIGDIRLADLKLKRGFHGAVCWEGAVEKVHVHVIRSGFLLRSAYRMSLS